MIAAFIAKLPWKWIGIAAAFVAALWAFSAWNYHRGVSHEQAAQAARVKAAQAKVVKTEARADKITKDVGKQVADTQVKIQTVTKTIIEKVPIYVDAKSDSQCVVGVGFVRLHDAAIAGRLPEVPAGAARADAPSGVALSTVSRIDNANFGQALEWRSIAEGWQDWYVKQAANR
jgi:hypothetical protein